MSKAKRNTQDGVLAAFQNAGSGGHCPDWPNRWRRKLRRKFVTTIRTPGPLMSLRLASRCTHAHYRHALNPSVSANRTLLMVPYALLAGGPQMEPMFI